MAFGNPHLQPALLNIFLAEGSLTWFIQSREVTSLLKNHQSLGAHTDIFMLKPGCKIIHYVWSHPVIKPFGDSPGEQCKHCGCFRPWKLVKEVASHGQLDSVLLQCRVCLKPTKTFLRQGKTRVGNGKSKKDERGDWYIEEIE